MCLNTGTPKNIDFSFETNGKLMALGVPILKHFRVDESGKFITALEQEQQALAPTMTQISGRPDTETYPAASQIQSPPIITCK